jgi:TrmH family RNA methyltransferase
MSISVAKIKHVQSLRIKKFRQKYNQFIVEGDKAVHELINSDWQIKEVFYTESYSGSIPADIFCTEIKKGEMERISQHQSPQDLLAVAVQKEHVPDEEKLRSGLTLLLDGIRDPGNLGTLIRIADWYGAGQLICSPDCVDLYNEKVIASSMGSFIRMPVAYAVLEDILKKDTAPAYACVMDGENVHRLSTGLPAVLVIGNEGAGIRSEILPYCNKRISIPRFGGAESLNAAVAAAVIMDRFRGLSG